METFDLLCVGSGPASLSAAINGASEGLRVCVIDGSTILGGQARESSAIENYPGFPGGITGDGLMGAFIKQALKFNTTIHCPVQAVKLRREKDVLVVTGDDYTEYSARAVLLGTGLSYRKLDIEGIGPLMGKGIHYGLPPVLINGRKKHHVVVVGGANSAGQAVLKLASNKYCRVTMVIRRKIVDSMSTYLIERIKTLPNVEVLEGETLTHVEGVDRLEAVRTSAGRTVPAEGLFIFIGAVPKTVWLDGVLQLDDRKFVRTWTDIQYEEDDEEPLGRLPFETTLPGVFAAGDVRVGSTKRIASAIGEGAAALQMIHRYLSAGN